MPEAAVIVLIILAFVNTGRERLCGLIAILAVAHLGIASYWLNLQGTYHLSAMIPSVIALLVLLGSKKITGLILSVCWIMFAQMLVNALGWALYENGNSAIIYDTLSAVFYIAIVLRLLIRTKRDGREYPGNRYRLGYGRPNAIRVQFTEGGKH